jgi:hypothetical protein
LWGPHPPSAGVERVDCGSFVFWDTATLPHSRKSERADTLGAPSFTPAAPSCVVQVWTGYAARTSIDRNPNQEESMIYKLAAYIHMAFARRTRRIVAALERERGQGTVEYVGLILLVSLLMVGMVAAMKGFNRSRS